MTLEYVTCKLFASDSLLLVVNEVVQTVHVLAELFTL